MKRGDIIWGLVLAAITALLIIPVTNLFYISTVQENPYLTGYIKFAVLATMGELLAVRISTKKWEIKRSVIFKALIWGVYGMMITLMFQLYSSGVERAMAKGYIAAAAGWLNTLWFAFLSSALMNMTFAPVFMSLHRITDTLVETRINKEKLSLFEIIDRINWKGFIKIVVCKTIPFFWIPVHTVVFMMPSDYRVLLAAYLSIVLGAILAFAKRKK